jgi:hypothetical protein
MAEGEGLTLKKSLDWIRRTKGMAVLATSLFGHGAEPRCIR